jgi:hypothetical protein
MALAAARTGQTACEAFAKQTGLMPTTALIASTAEPTEARSTDTDEVIGVVPAARMICGEVREGQNKFGEGRRREGRRGKMGRVCGAAARL